MTPNISLAFSTTLRSFQNGDSWKAASLAGQVFKEVFMVKNPEMPLVA